MPMDRRKFLQIAGATAFGTLPARAGAPADIKALLFDAFPIFDIRSTIRVSEQIFPGKGTEMAALWRNRQFEYQWLRVLSHNYADFWKITEDSLNFACTSLNLVLTDEIRARLMNVYMTLTAWPDVRNVLHTLKDQDMRVAFLSNMTKTMLDANVRSAGLDGMFDAVISSDAIHSYKPDPKVYQLGLDILNLKREQVLFVAFAGWDAAGAASFGYPTFWCNRMGAPAEQMGTELQAAGNDLDDLVGYLMSRN